MRWILLVPLLGCAAAPQRPMTLRRVTLYQNGIGYFERSGLLANNRLRLELATPELDDVLKTLTVTDRLGGAVATVDIPSTKADARSIVLDVRLSNGRAHDLNVSYAVPTPTWKAAYRVVLGDERTALLQAWAMINNATQEDWTGVELTLATGAPMSFALDLHTPEYVKRPDATGHLIAPTVLGPIGETTMGYVDHDADGILDVDDKCPEDRESANGMEDEDGCPDRGRVIVTDSHVMILERLVFAPNAEAIAPEMRGILDATAAVLRENPDIALLEIQGHASADEREAWGLAGRRATAIREALIQRGIAAHRLEINPYGATQPLDPRDPAKNRRVDFLILKRTGDDDGRVAPQPRVTIETVAAGTQARTRSAAVAGTVRYVVGEPITVPRGGSAMVAILNKPITGEDVLLYRPDGNAPGSSRHPFRAVRLRNTSGFSLEPGPIAIFARGTFVGDTLLQRLAVDETAWIPYALDGGTTVTVTTADAEQPVRIAAIERGVLTVENRGSHATTYAIAPGADPTKSIVIRHPKAVGYTAKELPPGTLDRGDAYLVPLPIVAGRPSTLTIDEQQPRRRTIALIDTRADLTAYLANTELAGEARARIAGAIDARRRVATLESALATSRTRIADISARATELRESLRTLEKVRGAEDLRKKLLANLAQATAESDTHAKQIGILSEDLAAERGKLADAIRELTL